MHIGYARVSKADGSQKLDLQIDALIKAGVRDMNIFTDKASGAKDDRPGLKKCLGSLMKGDVLYVYKLDRLGRSLRHLVNVVEDLKAKGVGFKVISGHGADIDTTTASGKLIFGMFATIAEFERELIKERVISGLEAARARGRNGGRKHKLTIPQLKLIQSAMQSRSINVSELCREIGITRATLYRYVSPKGDFRQSAKDLIQRRRKRRLTQH